jgi:hypothetical protein
VAIYTGAKALSRWPINDESTLTSIQILIGSEDKREKLRIYLLQEQQGTKKRIASVGNNINSPIRTSVIRLL